jgi:hypothetical protein
MSKQFSFYVNRATALTGRARDVTAQRDGYLFAALLLADDGERKSVCESVGVNKSYGSRFRKVSESHPGIATDARNIPETAKDGDPAAQAIGERVRDALAQIRAEQRAAEGKSSTPTENESSAPTEGESTPAPQSAGDVLRALAALREVAMSVTWGKGQRESLDELLAEFALVG